MNHYLDICEAIEEGDGQLVDHSDLTQTDFPSNIPIPSQLYLGENQKEHDSVREWVLAVSMDQKVDQVRRIFKICINRLVEIIYKIISSVSYPKFTTS